MEPSTGNALLDQAAMEAFRAWRFKPGASAGSKLRLPSPSGRQPFYHLDVKAKSTDEVLAAFRGPLIIELPLSFRLAPRSYSVDTPKRG